MLAWSLERVIDVWGSYELPYVLYGAFPSNKRSTASRMGVASIIDLSLLALALTVCLT